jgi:hypothetical protein
VFRLLVVIAILFVTISDATAQQLRSSTPFGDRNPQAGNDARNKQLLQQQRLRKLAEESQYEKALRSIPDQRSTDPWAIVRSSNQR